jgi:hypothetical protein
MVTGTVALSVAIGAPLTIAQSRSADPGASAISGTTTANSSPP